MFRSPELLFRPDAIAIVGASDTGGGGWPKGLYENLEHENFPARVYLVNPRRAELWGRKVYPDFASLPERIDLAIVIVPADSVPAVLSEAAAAGLRSALIFSARFGEGGDPAGAARADALRALSVETGMRIAGPNCMGALSLPNRLLLYPTPRVRRLPAGPVGVVFQSGGTFQYWLEQGAARGLGYSRAVSSGNELDLDMADYVDFLANDPHTRVIACMAEGVRRGDALMAAAGRALDAGKPVVMLKAGRSEEGRAAAASHTGALASDDKVFDAFCRKFGVVRVESLDEMIEASLAFAAGRLPAGPRVAMVGYSGGAKGLFSDYASDIGLSLPKFTAATREKLAPLIDPGVQPDNPLDTGAGLARRYDAFAEVCRIVAADENVDMISMQGQLPFVEGTEGDPALFLGVRDSTDKPVVAHNRMSQNVNEVGRAFQKAAGIPFLQRLPEVARTLKSLGDHAAIRRRGAAPFRAMDATGSPVESVLADHGVVMPKSAVARMASEAGDIAAEIGFPVAIKIVSPKAVHKTELGGVALGVTSAEGAVAAARGMEERMSSVGVEGFLVQEMASGLEVIVGIVDDPQFGPCLALGLGGVVVEAIRDVAYRLLPVGRDDVTEMIAELRGRILFDDFRGEPARDVDALAAAATGLSDAYAVLRDRVSEIEINPLVVRARGEGACAVDIRAVARAEPSG